MSSQPAISIRGLSKTFPIHTRRKGKGSTQPHLRSVAYLVRQVAGSRWAPFAPSRADQYVRALRGIDLDIHAGEVVGIIGRNGAGKTTLLKLLARVLEPTAGSIRVRGRVASILELGMGFMPELTLSENIRLHVQLAGLRWREVLETEKRILEFAQLEEYRDIELNRCPAGSFLRLSFATLINVNAEIILADEVLAAGGGRFREICEQRIRAAGDSGEAVLLVSHDMRAIRRICDRVVWIDHGRIRMSGGVEDVVTAYEKELLSTEDILPAEEDACRILDFRLLDGQRYPVGALQIHSEAYIECVFRVLRPDIAVTPLIELWTDAGILIFSLRCPKDFTVDTPTTFRAAIRLPADFLNDMAYVARCRLLVNDLRRGEEEPSPGEERDFKMTVFNTNADESVWSDWRFNMGGLIAPRLEWKHHQNAEMEQA